MNARYVICLTSLLLVGATGSAGAQQTTSEPSDTGAITELVVTARRITESLQSTPVTVSAFGAAQLEALDVNDSTELNGRMPNVMFAATGAGTGSLEVFIRGVGNNALAFNLEQPVGVYVDDVYLARLQGSLIDNLDLERVEVLRGPQGTLYGRSATVGAVKFVTKKPDLQNSRYLAEATLGSFSREDARISVSQPFVPGVFAAKLDISTRRNDGFVKDVDTSGALTGDTGNKIDRQAARLAMLWDLASGWQVNLAAEYAVDRSGTTVGTPLSALSGGAMTCNSAAAPCRLLYNSPYRAGVNQNNLGRNSVRGYSAHVDYDAQSWAFRSITSHRSLDGFDSINITGAPGLAFGFLPDHKAQNQQSQEFQFASAGDSRVTWITGLYFFREEIRHTADFLGFQSVDDHQTSKSYAVYADGTYEIVRGFHVELGARYSRDQRSIDRVVLPPGGGAPLITGSASFSENKATYKVGLDYHFNDAVMAYANYGTGYKPGSFGSSYGAPPVAPVVFGHTTSETANSTEVGVKSEWFDHRLRINLDGFKTEYRDLQQLLSTVPYPIITQDLSYKGVELEFEARPVPELTLSGSLATLSADITKGIGTGLTPRFAPKLRYSVAGEYRRPVSEAASVFVGANAVYTSRQRTDDADIPSVSLGAFTLIDAQLGIELQQGKYRIALQGKNLSNKAYFLSTSPDLQQYYNPPRTYAVTVSARL